MPLREPASPQPLSSLLFAATRAGPRDGRELADRSAQGAPLRPRSVDGLVPPKLENTLSSLVTRRCGLSIRCAPCQRDKAMPPLEAVASYGGLITFDELQGLLRSRCSKADCPISVHATHNPYRTAL